MVVSSGLLGYLSKVSRHRRRCVYVRCFATSRKATDSNQMKQDHAHCVDLVQQRDREGYLCGLLMPSHAQKSYFAIRAFNVELASIKDSSDRLRGHATGKHQQTSEGSSLALRMRMQWWRDALTELYQDDETVPPPEPSSAGFLASSSGSCWHNPVVRALSEAVEESQLTRRFLGRLVDAREADLDIQQMATMEDALMYAEDTMSSSLYLSLECVGVREDEADIVANHVGVGIGLVNAIRSARHRVYFGELSLPVDAFSSGIPPSQYLMLRGDSESEVKPEYEQAMQEAVQQVAHLASSHLAKARELQHKVPKDGRPCLLPAVPALQYLSKLQEAQFDVWHPKLTNEQSRLMLLTLLGRTWLTGVL